MIDRERNRQRLEDMLKSGEQRRPDGTAPAAAPRPADQARSDDEAAVAPRTRRTAQATGSAGTKLTAGMVLGGLSIPAALIPILGVILAVAAIVLGRLVGRRTTDVRATVAIGLGATGAALSLVVFVIALATA